MERITQKHLEYKVRLINQTVNAPLQPYSKNEQGQYKANIGNYHLSYAYGGVQLHKMCNDGGGVNTPLNTGYTTKRELYTALDCFLKGLETKKEEENCFCDGDIRDYFTKAQMSEVINEKN